MSATSIEEDSTLQKIIDLAHTAIDVPVALWRIEPNGGMRVHVAIGLPDTFVAKAHAKVGDNTHAGTVAVTGESRFIVDQKPPLGRQYPGFEHLDDYHSLAVLPIINRERIIGVVEAFADDQYDFDDTRKSTLQKLADIAGMSLENLSRAREEAILTRVTRQLSTETALEHTMRVVVDAAKELTHADSSLIFFFDQEESRFTIGARSGTQSKETRLPRPNGLTRKIIETGQNVLCNNTARDGCAGVAAGRERARALIGVKLDDPEWPGVIYVRSHRANHFQSSDLELLQSLAHQVSAALALIRFPLEPNSAIEEAASERFQLDEVLKAVSNELSDSAPLLAASEPASPKLDRTRSFDYVGIQLIRHDEAIIETVHVHLKDSNGKKWTGAKHSLEEDPKLRDIQADVALATPPRIEVITGWYEKFDRFIYTEFDHRHYARIWAPIILARDVDGNVVEDWFTDWDASTNAFNGDTFDVKSNPVGHRLAIDMDIPRDHNGKPLYLEVIGTIDAGCHWPDANWKQLKDCISRQDAIEFAKTLARLALKIRRPRLPYLLETIAERARRIMHADSASLHFHFNVQTKRYNYEVCSGKGSLSFLANCPPRGFGLGRKALNTGKPQFTPDRTRNEDDDKLKTSNPAVWKEGIQTIAAFPLKVDNETGVLYIHHRRPHTFAPEEVHWVQLFANRAVNAIRHATTFSRARDNAQTLTHLHGIAQYLVNRPNDPELPHRIAESTINILAADIVTIYEYFEHMGAQDRFSPIPETAGRLIVPRKPGRGLHQHASPRILVEKGTPLYITKDSANDDIMNNPQRRGKKDQPSFVERERIQASAGLLLKVGDEILGVMYVHYRRHHCFSDEELEILDILSSSAAIAIKNHRLLSILGEVREKVLTSPDLDTMLSFIVAKAANVVGGSVCDIRLLENPITRELKVRAHHPRKATIDTHWEGIKIGEGITGWVAKHKESVINGDVSNDERYKPYFSNIQSEISVPMLDADKHLLGTLTVGGTKLGMFDSKSEFMLRALASLTVLGIDKAERQQQLANAAQAAELGSLAALFGHRINNALGAIRQYTLRMKGPFHNRDNDRREKILQITNTVLEETTKLKNYVQGENDAVDLYQTIHAVLDRVTIPNNIELQYETPQQPSPLIIRGSRLQTREALLNLVDNAIDAMRNGGILTVDISTDRWQDRDWATIIVQDTGCGITEERLDRIFDSGSSTKTGRGLGMGLWLTRYYFESLSGFINVSSELGKGSTFSVALPLAPAVSKREMRTD
jgi:GAF domain-containing protein